VTEWGSHHGTVLSPPGSEPRAGLRAPATQFQSLEGQRRSATAPSSCWDWADRPVWFVSASGDNRPPCLANTSCAAITRYLSTISTYGPFLLDQGYSESSPGPEGARPEPA
jgi:hypothetical protein